MVQLRPRPLILRAPRLSFGLVIFTGVVASGIVVVACARATPRSATFVALAIAFCALAAAWSCGWMLVLLRERLEIWEMCVVYVPPIGTPTRIPCHEIQDVSIHGSRSWFVRYVLRDSRQEYLELELKSGASARFRRLYRGVSWFDGTRDKTLTQCYEALSTCVNDGNSG